MAKKKQTRGPKGYEAEPPSPKKETPPTNLLLVWWFNVLLYVVMVVLVVAFFANREIGKLQTRSAARALVNEDYHLAYRKYFRLAHQNPKDPKYLRALGDAAFGRGRFAEAIDYYRAATNGTFNLPGVKIQAALAYQGRAQTMRHDREKYQKDLQEAQRLLGQAYRESRYNVKVNYWMGRFAWASGDLIGAAKFFSHVRLPSGRTPTPEQRRFLKEAEERLAQIRAAVLKGNEHPLSLEGFTDAALPKLPRPGALPPTTKTPTTATIPTKAPATAGPTSPTTAPK